VKSNRKMESKKVNTTRKTKATRMREEIRPYRPVRGGGKNIIFGRGPSPELGVSGPK
jgi:hypothetical protein